MSPTIVLGVGSLPIEENPRGGKNHSITVTGMSGPGLSSPWLLKSILTGKVYISTHVSEERQTSFQVREVQVDGKQVCVNKCLEKNIRL